MKLPSSYLQNGLEQLGRTFTESVLTVLFQTRLACGSKHRKTVQPFVEALDSRTLLASGSTAEIAHIGSIVNSFLKSDAVPGAAVTVSKNGKILLERGYGDANLPSAGSNKSGKPINDETGFNIASDTKTFTAEAALLLAQKPSLIKKHGVKSLKLNNPIKDYVTNEIDPGGVNFVLPVAWKNVTVRQLMNMSSGININPSNNQTPWFAEINEMNQSLLFAPGTEYHYSNVNFWVLGELVEQLSGETYQQFVSKEILRPLGMNETSFLENDSVPGEATGYSYSTTTQAFSAIAPSRTSIGQWSFSAGDIVSTANDMGKYLSALTEHKLLSQATYSTMWTPTSLPVYEAAPNSHTTIAEPGLGWDDPESIETTSQGRLIRKDGAVPGFGSLITIYTGQHVGIAILCNREVTGTSDAEIEKLTTAIDEAITTVKASK